MIEKFNFWYVDFNIGKFNCMDDIVRIIDLLDSAMCGKEKIYDTDISVSISKLGNSHHDYICETDIACDKNTMDKYLSCKFVQSEKSIKLSNDEYGSEWCVNFSLGSGSGLELQQLGSGLENWEFEN